jgi:hypothetical protein
MAPVTTLTAVCEREGDWWVITVPELEAGGVTQARTPSYEPSATSPEAQAMLAHVLRSHQDPGGRHNAARLRRWRRTLPWY